MVRIKYRYVIVQLHPRDPDSRYAPEGADIVSGIQAPFTEMFGLFGSASVLTTLRVLDWNRERHIGVFRVARDWAQNVRSFFESIDFFSGIPIHFVVHHAAGTIEKARQWIEENDTAFSLRPE
jgi:RNase P/RNase MRP subunit POP5